MNLELGTGRKLGYLRAIGNFHWLDDEGKRVSTVLLPQDLRVMNKAEFLIATDEQGNQVAEKFHSTGSGLISSLRLSDGLIEIPEEVTELEAGTPVTFIPYTSFD